jgi:hypothetical protein
VCQGKAAEARPLSRIAQKRTSARRSSGSQLLPGACAVQVRHTLSTRQLPLILPRSNVHAGRAALKAPASAVDDLAPLVESAMLAAMTGLAYHFSASFRLESYLGALFPFPVVLAAARWGCDAAWKTLVGLTVLLVFSGFAPCSRGNSDAGDNQLAAAAARRTTESRDIHSASRYAATPDRGYSHTLAETLPRSPPGSLGMATGMLWSQKRHWLLSVPAAALVSHAMVLSIGLDAMP